MAKLDIDAALADHQSNVDEAIATATNRASGAELPSPAQFLSPRCRAAIWFLTRDDRRGSGNQIRSDRRRIRASLSRGRDLICGMEEQYRGTIRFDCCAFDGIYACFVGGPQVVQARAPGASNLVRNMAALRQLRPDTARYRLPVNRRVAGAIF